MFSEDFVILKWENMYRKAGADTASQLSCIRWRYHSEYEAEKLHIVSTG